MELFTEIEFKCCEFGHRIDVLGKLHTDGWETMYEQNFYCKEEPALLQATKYKLRIVIN